MHTKLAIVVALLAGIALGFFGSRAVETYRTNETIQALADASGADLSLCQMGVTDTVACTDAALLAHALQTQSTANCAYMSHESAKMNCENRVQFVRGLGDFASACVGAGSNSPCLDLAIMRSAIETGDTAVCGRMMSSVLMQACLTVVSGQPSSDTGGNTLVAQRSAFAYGLQCDSRDSICVENKQVFNRAVSTNQSSLCDTVAFAQDLCRTEVKLYQAFTTNSVQACGSNADEQRPCLFTIALAKAVASNSATACSGLEEQDKQACEQVVRTNKEPRFAYLEESL